MSLITCPVGLLKMLIQCNLWHHMHPSKPLLIDSLDFCAMFSVFLNVWFEEKGEMFNFQYCSKCAIL